MHWIDPDHLPETRGIVRSLVLNPQGLLDGLLLDDGTEIHVPPHAAKDTKLKAGQAVDVEGAWFESRHGTVVDVDHLAPAGHSLRAVR